MSHRTKLHENLGVIVLRYGGIVDFTELRNVFDELTRIPGFKAGLKVVADFRESKTPLTIAEVRKLADYAKSTDANWGVTKWAVIASEDLTFGLARMYIALTDDYQVTTKGFSQCQRSRALAGTWHRDGTNSSADSRLRRPRLLHAYPDQHLAGGLFVVPAAFDRRELHRLFVMDVITGEVSMRTELNVAAFGPRG